MVSNDGNSDDAEWMNTFLGELAQEPDANFPEWDDASDLGRLHAQAFRQRLTGGFATEQSSGSLRLTGDGVNGNSLPLAVAGNVLSRFQTLISSAGASETGAKSLRGPIAADVLRKTALELSASPAPGSVILQFTPLTDEAAERYPNDEIPVDETLPTPLIERSVTTAFRVLTVASSPSLTGDAVERLFAELGPRVASAARALADITANAHVDLNLSWQQPNTGRRKVRVSSSQSATFAALLSGSRLDSPVEEFSGIVRTVSDLRKIDVETTDPAMVGDRESVVVSISHGDVNVKPFNVGDRVRVQVDVQLSYRPGGTERRDYTAINVERSED